MKFSVVSLVVASALLPSLSQAALEVHEWGTFTSLLGSNGVTQNGMYHEDEELPRFVHGIGETQLDQVLASVTRIGCGGSPSPRPTPSPVDGLFALVTCKSVPIKVLQNNLITQKMETPVVYFYSDKPQHVKMNVQFPEGVVTESFPAPSETSPSLKEVKDGLVLAGGNTTYDIDILADKTAKLPTVDAENIYSHARHVDSNVIRSGSETEKFVFYRGLGRFQPKLAITSSAGALTIAGPATARPQAAFLIDVDAKGDARVMSLGDLRSRSSVTIASPTLKRLANHSLITENGDVTSGIRAKLQMTDALIAAGLNGDEATAMLDTWQRGYLKIQGLRLLYLMPRTEIDQVLPLNISPQPDRLVRVFVARMEILLDTVEAQIARDVLLQRDTFDASSLGRFSEPILHRVSEVATVRDPQSKNLFDRLIERAFGAAPVQPKVSSSR